ncbi:DNA polymerase III subunit delta [Candidatus Gracilibacteria bacterium]|nr:DNA polymerase III subunit delta [Candidatus Gracilibacteria bacterium]NJM86577.1 DNA polymerase III subunit delta [Hydrococcus sp. RU_2_2]NJP18880.1 DNA polymerase III subunit delta [Hydrococcus sp. CRU_1_1]
MPIYFFWGDDDFAIAHEVKRLHKTVLDPHWVQFNYDKISGDEPNATIQALERSMTPVFGMGGRLIWLVETTLAQQCPEALLSRLQETLSAIPPTSHLLLTSSKKPDSRLKSTKLLREYTEFQEFSSILPWKTEELIANVERVSKQVGVKLAPAARELLAELVGNNTRQLWSELEKLSLYVADATKPVNSDLVAKLVNATTQNSLQLAEAISKGKTDIALELITALLNSNEPALKIVATLVGQFRTWAIVKLQLEAGERDEKTIAIAAEINNPKRIFIIRKQIQALSARQLLAALPILLELEFNLKSGAIVLPTLQIQIVKLCQVFKTSLP